MFLNQYSSLRLGYRRLTLMRATLPFIMFVVEYGFLRSHHHPYSLLMWLSILLVALVIASTRLPLIAMAV